MDARPWYTQRDGLPPDDDERTYRWDRQLKRWVDIEQDDIEIDEDALEAYEERRRQRIAEQNEDDDEIDDALPLSPLQCQATLSIADLATGRDFYVSGRRAPAAEPSPVQTLAEMRLEQNRKPEAARKAQEEDERFERNLELAYAQIQAVLPPDVEWRLEPYGDDGVIVRSNVAAEGGTIGFVIAAEHIRKGVVAEATKYFAAQIVALKAP